MARLFCLAQCNLSLREFVTVARTIAQRDVPDYLSVDADSSELADVPYRVSLEPNLVVEFYSL